MARPLSQIKTNSGTKTKTWGEEREKESKNKDSDHLRKKRRKKNSHGREPQTRFRLGRRESKALKDQQHQYEKNLTSRTNVMKTQRTNRIVKRQHTHLHLQTVSLFLFTTTNHRRRAKKKRTSVRVSQTERKARKV